MKETQTVSHQMSRFASGVKTERNSSRAEASDEDIKQVRSELAKVDARIATLQSELEKKQASINALLTDDVRSNEEIADLKELVWTFHRGLPDACKCDNCVEVERSRTELEGLL